MPKQKAGLNLKRNPPKKKRTTITIIFEVTKLLIREESKLFEHDPLSTKAESLINDHHYNSPRISQKYFEGHLSVLKCVNISDYDEFF
uniref:Uncharacterized protein n=1 Tax=Glycine max TaxID=3847 RepID=K7LP32_SOYBN